jgi:condensin complex subunit 1
MLAAAKPEIVSEHIDVLMKIGLGQLGKVRWRDSMFGGAYSYANDRPLQSDFVLAKYSCIALRRIGGSQKKVKGALSDTSVRLPMDNPVFERLKEIVEKTTVDQEWFSMAEQAINTIYVLGEQPDTLCSTILQDQSRRLFGEQVEEPVKKSTSPEAIEAAQVEAPDASESTSVEPAEKEESAVLRSSAPPADTSKPRQRQMANAFELAQLLFTAGHVAIRQLLHLELVEREYKRRKAETEKKDSTKAATTEELDQVVGSVEDDIADMIGVAKEKELLHAPDALLSIYGKMAVDICKHPNTYKVCRFIP